MSDFARGRSHVAYCIRVKLSFWRQLPWALAGLGHESESVATRRGERALALYHSAPDDHEHHSMTLLACSPGVLGSAQLALFISRKAKLNERPHLEMIAARLRFISTTEGWNEARRALLKRRVATAPHSGATHIMFQGSQRPLRDMLGRDSGVVMDLAA